MQILRNALEINIKFMEDRFEPQLFHLIKACKNNKTESTSYIYLFIQIELYALTKITTHATNTSLQYN